MKKPATWRLRRALAVASALAALMCLLTWLMMPAGPESWTMEIRVTDVDDALSVQTKPCSDPFPQWHLIAIAPDRVPKLRDRTVGPEQPIVLTGVTADTVITLQLHNDVGSGGLHGAAIDRDSRRPMFAFSSPEIPDGVLERVWASSWFGDGRPAPLAEGCELGLAPHVVRAAAPAARPLVSRPFLPDRERRGWLLGASVTLLLLASVLAADKLRLSFTTAGGSHAPPPISVTSNTTFNFGDYTVFSGTMNFGGRMYVVTNHDDALVLMTAVLASVVRSDEAVKILKLLDAEVTESGSLTRQEVEQLAREQLERMSPSRRRDLLEKIGTSAAGGLVVQGVLAVLRAL